MRATRLALVLGALVSSSLAFAQITGDIVGSIRDDSGGAMPGVTVEARSPSFQGVRTAVTDSTGAFRLVLLPPGTYKVTAVLQGFARAENTVIVALGKTATSDFQLRPATTAEVVVTAEAPLVDMQSTTIGDNIDNRQINSLPTGRSYTSIAQISAGVSQQTTNTANFANTMVING